MAQKMEEVKLETEFGENPVESIQVQANNILDEVEDQMVKAQKEIKNDLLIQTENY